jgi:hypothetical protein
MEAYQVQPLPLVQAYADKMGVGEVIQQLVSAEMAIEPGPMGLGLILAPLSGRSPLYRLAEFFADPATVLLSGKAVAPSAFADDTVGRIFDRRYDTGTMQICTACAVRADQVFGVAKRYVHGDTPSITVYGDSLPPEESEAQTRPVRST